MNLMFYVILAQLYHNDIFDQLDVENEQAYYGVSI